MAFNVGTGEGVSVNRLATILEEVAGVHPALIERQDEIAAAGVDQEIGVLDPLGNALVGQEFAKVVAGQEARPSDTLLLS